MIALAVAPLLADCRAAAPTPSGATSATPLSGSPFGLFYGLTPTGARPTAQYMVDLGAEWSRQTMFWNQIEPAPGRFQWALLDGAAAIVDRAAGDGHQINLMVTLRTASSWAGSTSVQGHAAAPPKDVHDYYEFVNAVVRRARGHIRYWQIDNEIYSRGYWQGSADEYVRLLSTGYRAAKDADPDAQVVVAGIGAWLLPMLQDEIAAGHGDRALALYLSWAENNELAQGFPRPATVQDLQRLMSRAGRLQRQAEFVRRLLKKDSASHFDVLDLHIRHPYTIIPAVVEWAKNAMAREGYSRPIWISECSGPTYPELWPSDAVGERRQAEEVVKRYALALGSGAQRVFWTSLATPRSLETVGEYSHEGLLRPDLSKRPAYGTYRLMTQMLKGASAVRRLEFGHGVYGVQFTRPEGPVYVLWSDNGASVRLRAGPGHYMITDAFGSRSERDAAGEELELQLASCPVFVQSAKR
jgi:hypothetical protein